MSNIVSKDAIVSAIAECDEDGDGEIDYDEFLLLMSRSTNFEAANQIGFAVKTN